MRSKHTTPNAWIMDAVHVCDKKRKIFVQQRGQRLHHIYSVLKHNSYTLFTHISKEREKPNESREAVHNTHHRFRRFSFMIFWWRSLAYCYCSCYCGFHETATIINNTILSPIFAIRTKLQRERANVSQYEQIGDRQQINTDTNISLTHTHI